MMKTIEYIILGLVITTAITYAAVAGEVPKVTLFDLHGNAKLKGEQCYELFYPEHVAGKYCIVYKGAND